MPTLFIGAEPEDFDTLSSTLSVLPFGSPVDSSYVRAATGIPNGTTHYVTSAFTQAVGELWFSATMACYDGQSTGATPITFQDGGVDRLRIKVGNPTTTMDVYRFDGTTETLVGSITSAWAFQVGTGITARSKFDFKILYTSGVIDLYRDGVKIGTVNGTLTAGGSTTLNGFTLRPLKTVTSTWASAYSEVIAHTGSTLGMRLKILIPNAAGTLTQWTGTYAAIDEDTASDTDVINSGTIGQEWSCNTTGLPTGSEGQQVRAVKVSMNSARGDTGPTAIAIGVHTNGSASYGPNQAQDLTYKNYRSSTMELNPVTGLPWTRTELDALQIAFKAG